jgi:NAD(P)H-nitrite reductase large subunit
MRRGKKFDRRWLIHVDVPYDDRMKVAGFRVQPELPPCDPGAAPGDDEAVVCRCSRVKKSDIVGEIRAGVRDFNQLKASVRSGMGACGGNTCTELILRIFREEGVDPGDVTPPTVRPLETEVPLGAFAGVKSDTEQEDDDSPSPPTMTQEQSDDDDV